MGLTLEVHRFPECVWVFTCMKYSCIVFLANKTHSWDPPTSFLGTTLLGTISIRSLYLCVYMCVCVHNEESMLWESPHYKTVWALRPLKSSTASEEASRGYSGGLLDDWNNKLILCCLVVNGFFWNPLGWGLLSALVLVMFMTCGPCWLIVSQKNSNQLVIREENALIWVDEKLLGFWESPSWFPDLDGVLYIWSAPVEVMHHASEISHPIFS